MKICTGTILGCYFYYLHFGTDRSYL